MYCGIPIPANNPRIASTIISSTKVKPFLFILILFTSFQKPIMSAILIIGRAMAKAIAPTMTAMVTSTSGSISLPI
jgi:hypothetical protein